MRRGHAWAGLALRALRGERLVGTPEQERMWAVNNAIRAWLIDRWGDEGPGCKDWVSSPIDDVDLDRLQDTFHAVISVAIKAEREDIKDILNSMRDEHERDGTYPQGTGIFAEIQARLS